MIVITMTTVGFGRVIPLDNHSKIFTVFLIFASVVIVEYAISDVREHILSKNNIEEVAIEKFNSKKY